MMLMCMHPPTPQANRQRSVGSTAANADSSRSHSIMQFALKRPTPDGEGKLVGKISFIDLAGDGAFVVCM